MTEKIKGIVQGDPIPLEHCCMFALEQEDGFYLVVSTGRQAGKDSIFVAKGQEMEIMGCKLLDEKFKGVLVSEHAKINFKKSKNC